MKSLYPLKFETIFKDKIWGGNKIKTVLGKDFSPLKNCGETWEISGVKENVSVVANGPLKGKTLIELIESYKSDLLGNRVYQRFGNEFPLLVKFIDANDDLSIQVHPDDKLAKERHNSFGKTEMWYIFQADDSSKLISGFKKPVDKKSYLDCFHSGSLMDILNEETVKAGDTFFIPAGRVHTIGKGLLLAEIQQTSDITYRIYDFDRVDDNGNKRELHVDEAIDAIDYTYYEEHKVQYEDVLNEPVNLVTCKYFTTNKLSANQVIERNYASVDSFVIFICFEGAMDLCYENENINIQKGDAVLLPSKIKNIKLVPKPDFKILESYIV